jgi:hypothetical protein
MYRSISDFDQEYQKHSQKLEVRVCLAEAYLFRTLPKKKVLAKWLLIQSGYFTSTVL